MRKVRGTEGIEIWGGGLVSPLKGDYTKGVASSGGGGRFLQEMEEAEADCESNACGLPSGLS